MLKSSKRKSSKGPTILFDLPRYSRYRDLRYQEFFCLKKCVMFKGWKNLFEVFREIEYLGFRESTVTNATISSILAVAMVLGTSVFFFRKSSNACFIIYFNMCRQIRILCKLCHGQRERDDKIMKSCQF